MNEIKINEQEYLSRLEESKKKSKARSYYNSEDLNNLSDLDWEYSLCGEIQARATWLYNRKNDQIDDYCNPYLLWIKIFIPNIIELLKIRKKEIDNCVASSFLIIYQWIVESRKFHLLGRLEDFNNVTDFWDYLKEQALKGDESGN